MSESFILSLIFAGIILLIGFIGMTFGIARGFLATASILLGAELALWWGDNLGDRLSDLIDISPQTGHFLAGIFLLLLAVLLLGVGGSIVLSWGTPTRWGSLLGGLLGAANGALLIAMALRLYYLAYAGSLTSLPLDDSVVTRVLWRNFDWFILGFAGIASALLLYSRFARLEITVPDPAARASFARPIPPPVPRHDMRAMREQDVPVAPSNGSAGNGMASGLSANQIDNAVYAPQREAVTVNQPASQAPLLPSPMVVKIEETVIELPTARHTVRFCPNCGMTLDASDRFCPDCGFTL